VWHQRGRVFAWPIRIAAGLLLEGTSVVAGAVLDFGPQGTWLLDLPAVTWTRYTILGGGSTAIPGWVVTGSSVDYIGTFHPPAHGLRMVDLEGAFSTGGIRQTFATALGARHVVIFDLSGNPEGNPVINRSGSRLAGSLATARSLRLVRAGRLCTGSRCRLSRQRRRRRCQRRPDCRIGQAIFMDGLGMAE
jgi:hypothetical protein